MGDITARVFVSHVSSGDRTTALYFSPDYQDGRNSEWADATPSLSLTMVVKNEVADHFPQGARMELRFAEAPADD
jgi:hypothetical protein